MRTTDEQLKEILKRSDRIAESRTIKRRMIHNAITACACIALLVVAVVHIPDTSVDTGMSGTDHYGSLILSTSYMGYIVIGILAFALGILFTLLVQHYRELKKLDAEKERGDK